jgi:hypothetical protein
VRDGLLSNNTRATLLNESDPVGQIEVTNIKAAAFMAAVEM